MHDQGRQSVRRMIAVNRSQRCFLFFCAQRACANSDKRFRPAAAMALLAAFGAVRSATGSFALDCCLAAFFRAAHLARAASAIFFLMAGLTLRRMGLLASFTNGSV